MSHLSDLNARVTRKIDVRSLKFSLESGAVMDQSARTFSLVLLMLLQAVKVIGKSDVRISPVRVGSETGERNTLESVCELSTERSLFRDRNDRK